MNYEKILENNKPFIICESMPFLHKICKLKITSVILIIIFSIALLGSIIYVVFQDNKSINKILVSRESTLNAKLTRLENVNEMMEAEILLLKNEVKSLSRRKDRKKISKISKYLADTNVEGEGVEVLLSDNNSDFAPAQDSSTIIHNTDLLKFVNFLWANGATAISLNGERIMQNSSISCVGPTIIVNQRRITSPFVIKAVGENFNENEIKNDAFVLSLKLRGIELTINKKDKILIPAGKYVTFKE